MLSKEDAFWQKCIEFESGVVTPDNQEDFQQKFGKLVEYDANHAVEYAGFCLFDREAAKYNPNAEGEFDDHLLFQRSVIHCIADHAAKADLQLAAIILDVADFFAKDLGFAGESAEVERKRREIFPDAARSVEPIAEQSRIRTMAKTVANMMMTTHRDHAGEPDSLMTNAAYDFAGEALIQTLEGADESTEIYYLHVVQAFAHYHMRDGLEDQAEVLLSALDPELKLARYCDEFREAEFGPRPDDPPKQYRM